MTEHPDPNVPASAESTPVARTPLGRKLFKLAVRVCGVCFLLLLVIAGMLLLFPWSIPALDQKVQREWHKLTGLDLIYQRAVFRLLDGTITIEQPTIRTVDESQSLISLHDIVVDVSFAQFLFNKPPFVIDEINVSGDLELGVETQADGTIDFAEPWKTVFDRIGQHIDRHQSGGEGAGGDPFRPALRPAPQVTPSQPMVVLNRVTVEQLQVHWLQWLGESVTSDTLRLQPRLQPRAHRDWLELDSVMVQCDFSQSLRLNRLMMQGRFNRRASMDSMRLSMIPVSDDDIRCVLQLSEFDTLEDLPIELPLDARGRDIRLEGTIHGISERRWRLNGMLAASDLELIEHDKLEPQQHGEASIDWDLDLNLFAGELGLNHLVVRSELLDARTSGTLGLSDPFPYTLNLSRLGLHRDGMRLIADYLVPTRTGTMTHGQDAGVELVGQMVGNIMDGRPGRLTGRLAVNGVDWDVPQMPTPLRELRGSVQLTSDSLVLEQLSGQVLDLPVDLNGVIRCNALAGEVSDVDLTWRTAGSIEGVNALLELFQIRGNAIPEIRGEVDGEGFVRLSDPLSGSMAEVMQRIYIEGWLNLRNGELRHAQLPMPVTGIEGRIDMAGNQALLKSMRAECFGMNMEMEGTMRGHEKLWEEPSFDLRARLSTDLEVFLRNLDTHLKSLNINGMDVWAALMPITGQAELSLNLELPSTQIEEAQYGLEFGLKDFSINPETEVFKGKVAFPELQVALGRDELRIEPARGIWGAYNVALEAALIDGAGHISLDLEGDAGELQKQIPSLLPFLVFDGHGHLKHTQNLELAPGAQPISNWVQWVRGLPWGSSGFESWVDVAMAQWKFNMQGEIDMKDAEVTWYRMPTRIDKINGHMLYDNEHLWTPEPGTMRAGKHTRDAKGTVEVIYGEAFHGGPVVLNFHAFGGTLGLASWLGPYKPYSFLDEDQREADAKAQRERRAKQGPSPMPTPQPFDPARPPRTQPPDFEATGAIGFMVRGIIEPDSVEYLGIKTGPGSGYLDITVHRPHQKTLIHFRDMKAELYGGSFTYDSFWHDFWLYGKSTARNVGLKQISEALASHGIGGGGVITGELTAELNYANDFDQDPYGLYGNGKFTVTESDMISSTLFDRLARLINFSMGQKTHFSKIDGQFNLVRNVATFGEPGIVFDAPIMNLAASGKFGPGTLLDLQLRLQFLKIAENIPGLSQILSGINYVTGSVLRYKVRGTLENPDVSAL